MHRRRVLALLATSPFLAGCNSAPSPETPDSSSKPSEESPEQTTATTHAESSTPTTVSDALLRERDRPSSDDLPTTVRPPAAEPPNPTEDTVSPIPYPEKPTSYTAETVAEFVERYERAYRRNGLLDDHGRSLIGQMSAFHWTHTLAVDDHAGVGRGQYAYSESVERTDGVVVGDSPILVVTYYVDSSVVVRAQSTGRQEHRDVLAPDPWETGVVLEPSE